MWRTRQVGCDVYGVNDSAVNLVRFITLGAPLVDYIRTGLFAMLYGKGEVHLPLSNLLVYHL